MGFHYFAGAAFRALTARKDGPSLYDVCDPVLLNYEGGDPHLGQFYRTALGNPALRPLLRRTGLPELKDEGRLARCAPRCCAPATSRTRTGPRSAQPVAELWATSMSASQARAGDRAGPRARHRARSTGRSAAARRICCAPIASNGFLPTYAAFNLLGDADMGGREMLMALTGLNSRGYKNSTLLFILARIFIAQSPARALINPPWTGIAEPMWEPMQIRHRSAYYDAFFTEALLELYRDRACLAGRDRRRAARHRRHGRLLPQHQPRRSVARMTARRSTSSRRWRRRRIRASPASSPRSSRTSASASTCRIATPPPARSPPRRRPARPIRSSTSRCWISTAATRCAPAPTSRASPCRSTTISTMTARS